MQVGRLEAVWGVGWAGGLRGGFYFRDCAFRVRILRISPIAEITVCRYKPAAGKAFAKRAVEKTAPRRADGSEIPSENARGAKNRMGGSAGADVSRLRVNRLKAAPLKAQFDKAACSTGRWRAALAAFGRSFAGVSRFLPKFPEKRGGGIKLRLPTWRSPRRSDCAQISGENAARGSNPGPGDGRWPAGLPMRRSNRFRNSAKMREGTKSQRPARRHAARSPEYPN